MSSSGARATGGSCGQSSSQEAAGWDRSNQDTPRKQAERTNKHNRSKPRARKHDQTREETRQLPDITTPWAEREPGKRQEPEVQGGTTAGSRWVEGGGMGKKTAPPAARFQPSNSKWSTSHESRCREGNRRADTFHGRGGGERVGVKRVHMHNVLLAIQKQVVAQRHMNQQYPFDFQNEVAARSIASHKATAAPK